MRHPRREHAGRLSRSASDPALVARAFRPAARAAFGTIDTTISQISHELTARSGLEAGIERFLEQLDEAGAGHNTILAYRTDLNQFARFIHPRLGSDEASLENVSVEMVALFAVELEARRMKPATVARKQCALRAFFRFLMRRGVLDSNPASLAAGDGSRRSRRLPPKSLTLRQVEQALEVSATEAGEDFSGARDRAIVEVLYGGGLRLSELVGLNLTSLHLDEGEVVVARSRQSPRRVPIGSKAVEAVRAYVMLRADLLLDRDMSRVDAGALFVNRQGKRLHRRSFQRIASRVTSRIADDPTQSASPDASSAGNAAGPRLLRDSFTAHMLAAGAGVASVARLLGQSTVSAGSSGGERGDIAQLQAKYERAHPRSGLTCDRGADRGAQADGAEDRGPQQVQ